MDFRKMGNVWDNDDSLTTSLWRYFKVHRFKEFLNTSQLYFSSAREFEDRFEGAVAVLPPDFSPDPRYSELEHLDRAFEQLRRLSKISCWHIEEYESAIMWQTYANSGKGIAIKTNLGKILDSVVPYYAERGKLPETIYYGKVEYKNLLEERLSPNTQEQLFYKDRMFSSEKEYRFMISLRIAEEFGVKVPEKGILVDFKLNELIDEIYLGPNLDELERTELEECIQRHGFGSKLRKSAMLGTPRYV